MTQPRSIVPRLDGILTGSEEPVFRVLPQGVIDDMKRSGSESALLWNCVYPRAQPTLALADLLSLTPLWGSNIETVTDDLIPYYWGFDQTGLGLPQLDRVLEDIDGPGPRTEVDLFLLGQSELILVEAKHMAAPGRCSRYGSERCPEIHLDTSEAGCRYWVEEISRFSYLLDFGSRPEKDDPAPPCNRHYQLGRTVLVGSALARKLDRRLHLWLMLPKARWEAIEPYWIDFSERIVDDRLWRRLRVIAWEAIHSLDPRSSGQSS
ncbi:MAG: hypothetical protein ACE5JF_00010 [Anaerolineales bacterium]